MEKNELKAFLQELRAIDGVGTRKLKYAVFKNTERAEREIISNDRFIKKARPKELADLETQRDLFLQKLDPKENKAAKLKLWEKFDDLFMAVNNYNEKEVDPFMQLESEFEVFQYDITKEDIDEIEKAGKMNNATMHCLSVICPNLKEMMS